MKRLYWIGSIDDDLYKEFTRELYELEESKKVKKATLEVASEGGHEDTGFALYGRVISSNISLHAVGHGLVHSAALLGFIGCASRTCTPECTFLIHNSTDKKNGDYRKFKQAAKILENNEIRWAEILERHTGTEASFWLKLSDDEVYLNAEDALKYGIVHEIVGKE